MAPRKTIGDNPLDSVIPAFGLPAEPVRAPIARPARAREPERVAKERLTVHLPVDLIDRVKNAVYWTPGLTLAGLSEDALRKAVDRLEKERGEPYPRRRSELKGGRPLK
jgi:hypothetical protein